MTDREPMAFVVDVRDSQVREDVTKRLAHYGRVVTTKRAAEVWALLNDPETKLVGIVSDRDAGTFESERCAALYVSDVGVSIDELNDWTIYAIALSLTSNPLVADAVRTLAERWDLSVRKAELLAALVTTGSIKSLSTLLGVSDNTTKTLAQRLLMSARKSEEGRALATLADLLRAVLVEVAGESHVAVTPAERGGDRRS